MSSIIENIHNKACGCNLCKRKYMKLTHLHLHTEYSALDGLSKIDDIIKQAKEYGHESIGITDHGNMSGNFEFFKKCKAAGIKPIFGCEFYLSDEISKHENKKDEGKNSHQSIFMKGKKGFVNINKLNYQSFSEENYYRTGRISTGMLLENKEDLIVTSSCMASLFAKHIELGREDLAEERIKLFRREFGDDFYAEIQFNEIPQQKIYNHFILRMMKKYDIPGIITNDVHYPMGGDDKVQDVLIAIQHKTDIHDSFKLQARNLYYLNGQDFHDFNKKFGYNYPEKFIDTCLENTNKFAEKCNFEFETGVDKYPKYEPEPEVSEYFKTKDTKEIITKLSHAKLNQKLNVYRKNGLVEINDEVVKKYRDRLDYELKVIDDKGMLDYFMVVWELIKFCEKNDISVGCGRGSVGGSLLAWVINISKIDAIRFNLYFERFMNPERMSSCDIDTDFEMGSDEKTTKFLYEKYGKERVISVATFSRFSEKMCFKDVVKALGGDTGFSSIASKITSEMPSKPTWERSLEKWFEWWPTQKECSEEVKSWILDPANIEVINTTLKLQGQVRNVGKHAAGICILPSEVWNFMPCNISKKQIVSGFQESGSGKDLSELGILKLDRLNLETLNVIKDAIRYVKEFKKIDIKEKVDFVDLTDRNLFIELRMGNNQGIFQFESQGMQALISGMKIDKFDELVAANALYRPGSLNIGAHTEYIRNKFDPQSAKYVHPALEPILKDTNGVLVYQEQLMFIANKIGGVTLGEGDELRRYMDKASSAIAKELEGAPLNDKEKKDYANFKKYWDKFLDGAEKNGYKKEEVDKIKEWLIQYLGYSFNKCLSENHTVISETRGKIPMLSVEIGENILGLNPKTRELEFNPVVAIHKNGIKKVYKMESNNSFLECTLDHKIMTVNYEMETLEKIYYDKLKIAEIDFYSDSDYVGYDFNEPVDLMEEYIGGIDYIGELETYDLEIDSPFHNFYANGICVSNSHSLAYSYLAMQTLYLKHYHPTEFYCALFNHPKSNNDKEKEKQWICSAILSAMSKGINIIPPTRKSNWEWTIIDDKTIAMGFSGINGMGDIAYAEYKKKKAESLTKDEFFGIKLSKFNKKSFEVCLKAGLFDDWSSSRDEILEWRKAKLTNVMQLDIFGNFGVETKTKYRKFEKTPEEIKQKEFLEVCSLDLSLLNRIHGLRKQFKDEYDLEIEPVTNFDDENNFYYFCLNKVEEKLTKNNRKMYYIHLSDGGQVKKIIMWDNLYRKLSSKLIVGGIYITKFIKSNGFLGFNAAAEFRKVF